MSHDRYIDRGGAPVPYLGGEAFQQAHAQGRVFGRPPAVESPCWIPDQKQGELISDGNNGGRTGRVWDGPPLINPNTGRPYKGCLLAMSRNRATRANVIEASAASS